MMIPPKMRFEMFCINALPLKLIHASLISLVCFVIVDAHVFAFDALLFRPFKKI